MVLSLVVSNVRGDQASLSVALRYVCEDSPGYNHSRNFSSFSRMIFNLHMHMSWSMSWSQSRSKFFIIPSYDLQSAHAHVVVNVKKSEFPPHDGLGHKNTSQRKDVESHGDRDF